MDPNNKCRRKIGKIIVTFFLMVLASKFDVKAEENASEISQEKDDEEVLLKNVLVFPKISEFKDDKEVSIKNSLVLPKFSEIKNDKEVSITNLLSDIFGSEDDEQTEMEMQYEYNKTQITIEENEKKHVYHQEQIYQEQEEVNYENDDEEAKELVLCLTYAEAGIQGREGMKLVLETIRNRLYAEEFPDTLKEVCLDEGQFIPIENGVPHVNGEEITSEYITEEMKEIYEEVILEGSNETEELLKKAADAKGINDEKYWKGGALFFSNLDEIPEEIKSDYENIKVSVKVGRHTFWRYWDK